ncbi:MAG: hypothetical protein MI861_00075 [Pirellulales bacterium]|nr:hypothetical protein [Pirellulales bacterium]
MWKIFGQVVVMGGLLIGGAGMTMAQSTGRHAAISASMSVAVPDLPQPVRQAEYLEAVSVVQPSIRHPLPIQGSPAHQILRSPVKKPSFSLGYRAHHAQTHPPLSSYHRRASPSPAKIPRAHARETWKRPYSYGYFGASPSRQWTLHYGYRDRYTQWRAQ